VGPSLRSGVQELPYAPGCVLMGVLRGYPSRESRSRTGPAPCRAAASRRATVITPRKVSRACESFPATGTRSAPMPYAPGFRRGGGLHAFLLASRMNRCQVSLPLYGRITSARRVPDALVWADYIRPLRSSKMLLTAPVGFRSYARRVTQSCLWPAMKCPVREASPDTYGPARSAPRSVRANENSPAGLM